MFTVSAQHGYLYTSLQSPKRIRALALLPETIEVIKSKFERSVEAHRTKHCEDLKNLLSKHGIPVNREVVAAYLLGVLRAIAYDSKSFIQGEGLEWGEFEDLVSKLIGRVMKAADDITGKC